MGVQDIPPPLPATTVVGPDAFGAPAVVGTKTTYAREDHDHGLPSAPSSSLTNASGHIASDVQVQSNTTIFSTASLAIGTWHVHVGVSILTGNTGTLGIYSINVVVGSGTTATFEGQKSTSQSADAASSWRELSIDFIATITVAGTLKIVGFEGGGTGGNFAKATDQNGDSNATGYTAEKIG